MDEKMDDSPEGQETLLSQLAEDFQYEVRPTACLSPMAAIADAQLRSLSRET